MRVLGIMSGTSIDSVDYAVCDIQKGKARLVDYWQVLFPAELARRLRQAAADQISSYGVGQLHHDLGRLYARGARKAKVDLAGLHGQTIFHNPKLPHPATFQIGEPVYLAQALQAPVVSNFRVADLAAGGQGAPLATMFHKTLFAQKGKHIAVHNLGGISNVTSLDWTGGRLQVRSFDTGPANMLIDLATQKLSGGAKLFDRNGSWAARGTVNETLLRAWLRHPFYRKSPPKSTGRELFGETCLEALLANSAELSPADILATVTELTARSVELNYRLHLASMPGEVIVCGGGASNLHLMKRLQAQLKGSEVLNVESKGWPTQSIEPAAFALLAYLRIKGRPGNIPSTTGARREVCCGQVTEP
ncbi:MAG: anhydro-N-acetylmuramic acid kinase [Verrucomicrobiales bacterium]